MLIIGTVAAKIILGVTVAIGGVGAAKGVKGAVNIKKTKDVQCRAEQILNRAKGHLEIAKKRTSRKIIKLGKTKLKAYANEINSFVTVFSGIKNVDLKESIGLEELKKLNIGEGTINDMKDVSLKAINVLNSGLTGAGAGVLLGWGAYGGVMALGTASTGTAIGSLYGVAATNATLAWLGGGALAAGGGGMALGSIVLGGIIAGPALLVAGVVFGAKAKEKLNNAYSNLAEAEKISEEFKTAGIELNIIGRKAFQVNSVLKKLVKQFKYTIEKMEELTNRENDWKKYSDREKNLVTMAFKYAQIVKGMIDMPLLTEDGVLTSEIKGVLENSEIREFLDLDLQETF